MTTAKNGKRLLITGGAGFIGSVLSGRALDAGFNVRVVDALWFNKDIPLIHKGNPSYEFIRGDLRDSAVAEAALKGVEYIVHAAAIVGEPACDKYPELTKQINSEVSLDLIERARNGKVKGFIFFSTCSNYGIADGLATEATPLNPLSLYAKTKVGVERKLMETTDMDWIICRLSTVYGYSPRMRFDLTINDFTMNAFAKKYLGIFLPYTYRPYIHVHDLANVIVTMLGNFERVKNNVFNVGFNGENFQKMQIAEAVRKQLPDTKVEVVKSGMDRRDYQVDFTRLHNFLKVNNRFSLDSGIGEILSYLRDGLFADPYAGHFYNTNPDIGGK